MISLTLDNIKSYIKETIYFYEGVNFISGGNGAGKTTIIEAIGFALFDANPFSSLRHFIREGERSGTITVVFEAGDERLYRVVRTLRLPSGGSWAVFDEESGAELSELHGNRDVKAWLAENLGMGGDLEPTLLFEDVVGISQGKFTAPFLERPARRKEIFNTILQLDGYRDAFMRTSGLDALFEKSIAGTEAEKSALLVRAEDLPECREQLKKNEDRTLTLKQELEKLSGKLDETKKEIERLERLKQELEKGQQELQVLQAGLTGLYQQKARLEQEITGAREQQGKVEQATPGYLAYLSVQEQQQELERNRKKRDALALEGQILRSRIAVLEAEISGGRENRDRQLREGETELHYLGEQGQETASACELIAVRENETLTTQEKIKDLQNSWQRLDDLYNRGLQHLAALEHLNANWRQVEEETDTLAAGMSRLAETEKLALEAPGLEKELETAREALNAVQVQAAALEDNRRASQGGKCPFLQEPCKNIAGGNLEEYFRGELAVIAPRIESLRRQKEESATRLAGAHKALEEYRLLQHNKTQLEKLRKQGNECREAIRQEAAALLANLHPRMLEPLLASMDEAAKILEAAGIESGEKDRIIRERMAMLSGDFSDLHREAARSRHEVPLSGLTYERLPGLVAEMKKSGAAWWERLDSILNKVVQEINSELAGRNTTLAALRERYRKVSENLLCLKEDRSLQNKELELQKIAGELSEVAAQAGQYESLEEEWEKNKKAAAMYEPAYLRYMQNLEGAGRLAGLCLEMQSLQSGEQESLEAIDKLREYIRDLDQTDEFNLLVALKTQQETLAQEKGEKTAELDHAVREAERYLCLVAEKEKVLVQIKILDGMVEKEKKARQLLRLVRQTLNQSGELIAQEYRKSLGREADLIYQRVAGENVHLVWADDYEVKIVDNYEGRERERVFGQFSGGEKMTAALAVRLALLKQLSGIGVGFFDEPTDNLDENRRINLARIIPEITKVFRQIFVISHDDAFDAITENVIMLKKEPGRGTRLFR